MRQTSQGNPIREEIKPVEEKAKLCRKKAKSNMADHAVELA
jgi:hypothetical protein